MLKPRAQVNGYWSWSCGSVVCHLFFFSSECALQIMGSKIEFHGWQLLVGQAKIRVPGGPKDWNL